MKTDVCSTRRTRGKTEWRDGVAFWTRVCALGMVLFLCSCSKKPQPNAGAARPPVPVTVAAAETRDVPVRIQAIGTVEPYSSVRIRPQITGPLLEVHFEEGQYVKAGDLLFTIDPRPWEAALNQAQAALQRDTAQMVNARLQFQRASNLFATKIASQADLDTAEAAYNALQATLVADAAAVTNAQVSLGYTEIRAPIDGRTGSLSVKRGNVVKATDDVLVTITQTRPAYVAFAVPEQHLADIRSRAAESILPVEAHAPSDPARSATGRLTFIDNRVDTNTGTILLKATFPNTNEFLWPGQFVQAVLTLSNMPAAVVVPSYAVQAGRDGEFVFVITNGGFADARMVDAGLMDQDLRVINSGLAPGETVVTDGQSRLVSGARVSIKTEGSPSTTNRVGEANP